MGNRSSASSSAALLLSPAQLQKRFTAEELRRLEAQAGGSGNAAPLTREQFLAKVGKGGSVCTQNRRGLLTPA